MSLSREKCGSAYLGNKMTKIEFSTFSDCNAKIELETSLKEVSDEDILHLQNNNKFGIFRILNQIDGDKRLIWNKMNLEDIREAENMFQSFVAEGLQPHRIDRSGAAGSKMENFDPLAEEIIFLPMKMVVAG